MTDYISKEQAAELLEAALEDDWEPSYAIDRLSEISPADVVPVVRGEWIKCGRDRRPLCSKCGYEPLEITREYIVDGKPHSWDSAYNLSNFCPNCGAEMARGNGGQG